MLDTVSVGCSLVQLRNRATKQNKGSLSVWSVPREQGHTPQGNSLRIQVLRLPNEMSTSGVHQFVDYFTTENIFLAVIIHGTYDTSACLPVFLSTCFLSVCEVMNAFGWCVKVCVGGVYSVFGLCECIFSYSLFLLELFIVLYIFVRWCNIPQALFFLVTPLPSCFLFCCFFVDCFFLWKSINKSN